MPRESRAARSVRALAVMQALDRHMPEAKIELAYTTPLELLVAVVLSAQARDARVNLATPALFRDYPTPAHLARAKPEELEGYLRTLGLFRAKARALVALGQQLVEHHNGEVPRLRAQLAELPGVGLKTAGVVSMHLGGEPAFPVDTHVARLSGRLDFSREKTPDTIEADLQKLLPVEWWVKGHQLLVWHGRRTCHAARPACTTCVVHDLCPRRGVTKST